MYYYKILAPEGADLRPLQYHPPWSRSDPVFYTSLLPSWLLILGAGMQGVGREPKVIVDGVTEMGRK